MPEIPETIGPRAGTAPVKVTLSELGTVDLEGSFAHYDGSGASGSFLPALTIRSQDGSILSRVFPSTTLASGDTADVTFVPLGEADSASGIRFDTSPQAGDWLEVTTTGGVPPPGFPATKQGDLYLHSNGGYGEFLYETSGGGIAIVTEILPSNPAPAYNVGGGGIQINEGFGGIALEGKTTGEWTQDGTLSFTSGTTLSITATTTVAVTTALAGFTLSQLAINALPTSDPGVAHRVWADNGVLVYSGHSAPTTGIVFDSPNVGGSLSIETNVGDQDFKLPASQHFHVYDSTGNLLVDIQESGGVTFTDPTQDYLFADSNLFDYHMAAGATFQIRDSGGNVIFRVDEDGSIHGLASVGAITWDL